jgi:predicted DsbA family dithiol-disulfide isomerase
MKVEIWSDVVCPWCYVGKRHFEEALSRFPHRDDVSVEWRSFELDPNSPPVVDATMTQILQRKYGMSVEQADQANAKMTALAAGVGLEYHLDRAQAGNTFDAHRLIHLAASHGLGDAMKERLLARVLHRGPGHRRP